MPVFIVVQDLLEQDVFATMIREGAEGWSPFELGTSIGRAFDAGLFPSRSKLAAACGLKLQVISAAIDAASLPDSVVQAFGSPTRLTSFVVRRLVKAVEADPVGVERRARALKPGTSNKDILAALLYDSAGHA